MMKSIIILFLIFLTPLAFSQDEWWQTESDSSKQDAQPKNENLTRTQQSFSKIDYSDTNKYNEPEVFHPGKITVIKSPLIDKVIRFKSATIPPYSGSIMDGYRIQLFFDQSRKEVDKARSQVLGIDSDTPTYIQYNAPNYILLQGNYRTELQAEKVRSSMVSQFPTALVIKDKIYLPEIKIEKEDKSTN